MAAKGDKLIVLKEKVYEIYTASGNRIVVKGCNMLINYSVGDITILDANGETAGQFIINNIEGWRVSP